MIQLKWPSNPANLATLLCLALAAGAAWAAPEPEPPLDELLAGEFAAQEGDYQAAATQYLAAALASDDPQVAERATQMALAASSPEQAVQALARWQELAPDGDGVLAMQAVLALRENRQEAAHQALVALLARPAPAWRLALRALLSSGNAEASASALSRILQERALPDDLSAWLAFGGLAQRLFQTEPGPAWVAAIVEKFPDQPRAWLLNAGQLRRAGDSVAAREAIDRALSLDQDDENVRLAAAVELEQLGDVPAALAVLARPPQTTRLFAARATILDRTDDRKGLEKLYREVRESGADASDSRRQQLLGQLAEVLGEKTEALDWYRSVPAGPDRSQALLRVALLLNEVGEMEAALAQLAELRLVDPDDGDLLRSSYLIEAEILAGNDRPEQALAAYGDGLKVLEGDPELLYARALMHERMGDIAAAEADFRRILHDAPDDANVLNALGYTLADRTDRLEEAKGYIEKALAAQPDSAAVIDSMGWVLYRLGRLEEALPYLRRAFELQPDPEIAAHLGEALWSSDRLDQAREIWRQGLEIDAGHAGLLRTLKRLAPELLP